MNTPFVDEAEMLLSQPRVTKPMTIPIAKLAMIVHEMRTPLMTIQGLNSLGAHETDPAVLADSRDRIESVVNHLLEIVNDILSLAEESQTGKLTESSRVMIGTLMNEVVAVVQTIASTRNILILDQIDTGVPEEFFGQIQRLRQVLINLLTNAVKFSAEGLPVLLRVRRDDETQELCFDIEDNGMGMSDAEIKFIFQPFATLGRTAPMETCGTGLGLPICRSMVENMGGKIEVKSELGKGSCFSVRLPYASASPPIMSNTAQESTATETEVPAASSPLRILVVDDSDLIRDVLLLMLEKAGFAVNAVGSPVDALTALRARRYDMVLLDQNLGHDEGDQLAMVIRGLPEVDPKLKIIGMSAYYSDHLRAQALASGMNDFVLKTTRLEDLVRLVRNGMGKTD